MEIDAGRLVLRPIGQDVARALLDGRAPEGVVLADGYPSQFSLEVLEMGERCAHGLQIDTARIPWER